MSLLNSFRDTTTVSTMEKEDVHIVNNELVFNPYNTTNKEISLSKVQTILETYGVSDPPTSLDLYQTAFVHSSYCTKPDMVLAPRPPDCIGVFSKSNERLEFLGDGILECVAKNYMYKRFSNENEGFMTEKKIALVKNESIGKLALQIGLHTWYVLSKHSEEKKMRTNLKRLGCLFESFLGAIFLDFKEHGFRVAQTFIEHVIERHVDWTELILCDDNYKNILQVKLQKEFKITPEYLEISHKEFFHMGVYLCIGQPIWKTTIHKAIPFSQFGSFEAIHDYMKTHSTVLIHLGEGHDKIKKKSEQLACENALRILM